MDISRYTRLVAGLLLGSVISIPLSLSVASPANATAAPPNLSAGYYILSPDAGAAYKLGEADAKYDTSHGYVNRLAVLDFGGQQSNGSGTKTINNINLTNLQIENIAEQYGVAYFDFSGASQSLEVAVGTNNSFSDISSSGGAAWHGVLHAIWTSQIQAQIQSQVAFIGGNDIEDWWASTTPGAVESWATGWDNSTTALYLNFGSASGCPETSYTGGNGMVCTPQENSNFYQGDYWKLSWGFPNAISEPQIYYSANAQQWTQICLYSRNIKSDPMFFQGPMNQYYAPGGSSSDTPGQSWSQFWNDLNATACAQNMLYETSIKDE